MDLVVQNKVSNPKPKKSKAFPIRGKVGKCEFFLHFNIFEKHPYFEERVLPQVQNGEK